MKPEFITYIKVGGIDVPQDTRPRGQRSEPRPTVVSAEFVGDGSRIEARYSDGEFIRLAPDHVDFDAAAAIATAKTPPEKSEGVSS